MFLLQDFNSNQFNVPLTEVEKIVPNIPNITVTTIPINSVKARYYVNAKQYDKALALLNKGTQANPYLYYSEILKSIKARLELGLRPNNSEDRTFLPINTLNGQRSKT